MVQDVNSSAYLSESYRQDQNTTYFKKTDIYKSLIQKMKNPICYNQTLVR